jgi:hypothetical protein
MLARGSTWYEQLGDGTQDGYTVQAYGSGDLPTIDASDEATGWTLATGSRYTIGWTPEISSTGLTVVYEDGFGLTEVESLAACEATAGTFYAPAIDGTEKTISVHASDSGNPNTNGKSYRISKRGMGIWLGDNCTVANVRTQRQAHDNGSTVLGDYSNVYGCEFLHGHRRNMTIKCGTVRTSVFRYSVLPVVGFTTLFVASSTNPTCKSVTLRDCVFADQPTSYTIKCTTPGDKYTSFNIERCLIYNCYGGVSVEQCLEVNISDTYFLGADNGVTDDTSLYMGKLGDYAALDRCVFWLGQDAIPGTAGHDRIVSNAYSSSTYVFRNCIFDIYKAYSYFYGTNLLTELTITNCVFADDTRASRIVYDTGTDDFHHHFSYNICVRPPWVIYEYGGTSPLTDTDYNLFADGTPRVTINGTEYANLSLYIAAEDTDQNSVIDTPTFETEANANRPKFINASDSPAINIDGNGNDAGLMEYISAPYVEAWLAEEEA